MFSKSSYLKMWKRGWTHCIFEIVCTQTTISFNNAANVTKSHIHATKACAHLEECVVQTTPMKKCRSKDLQSRRWRTRAKVCVACEGHCASKHWPRWLWKRNIDWFTKRLQPMLWRHEKNLQFHKWRTRAKICAAGEGVLPSIELDDYERNIGWFNKDYNQCCEDMRTMNPYVDKPRWYI